MDLHPPTHIQVKIPKVVFGICYIWVSCKFSNQLGIICTKKDQRKTCLGYVAPKPQRWQMSSFGSWVDSIVNQLRAHSHIWIYPKIIHFVESKSSTWQNIADLNMNTRSGWNNQKTIWTSFKGIITNRSWTDYGCIGH
jgi:hypothetical protein